jgi:hypothetical protein
MKLYLTEFTSGDTDYAGPNILADTKQEAELICKRLNCRIIEELHDVIMSEYELETLH